MYNLHNIENPPISCELEKYQAESSVISGYLKWVKQLQLGSRKKYPNNPVCGMANLTPRGLVQHIYNGKYLGRLYAKLLFNNNQVDSEGHYRAHKNTTVGQQHGGVGISHMLRDVYVRSTDYSRTFQSALGFMYGFRSVLPDRQMPFRLALGTRATNLCSSQLAQESCSCYSLFTGALDKIFPNNRHDKSILEKKWEGKEQFGNVIGVTARKVPWLGSGLEVLMGYVCQGSPLPCVEETGECITKELLQKIWTTSESVSQYESSTDKETVKNTLVIHPLLKEIAHRLLNITQNVPSHKFVLYSGHDHTLTPLAIALGVNDGKIPSYASRLVFELYSKKEEYFIRILFNGKDLTESLKFCDKLHYGLCPLDYFLKFVFSGLKQFKNATYQQLCNLR